MNLIQRQKDLECNDLVSVIITTYNRSSLLEEAIQSVINQTYRPIECIIIDDGSTDNSKKIVEKLQQKSDSTFSIVYVYQDNSGPQAARNIGTKISIGKYVQYLDSDDILYADKLSKQVSFLKDNEDCDGVFGDWEAGIPLERTLVTAWKEEDMIAQMLTGRCIANFSFLMRRNVIEKIGEWDINIKRNQEIDFHLTGLVKGANFEYNQQICGLWRSHNEVRVGTSTGLADLLVFFNKWERILRERNKFNQSLAHKMGNLFMWLISQNKNCTEKELLIFLKKAITLNPNLLGFNQSRKIKCLKNLLGNNIAFKIWSSQYRKSIRV